MFQQATLFVRDLPGELQSRTRLEQRWRTDGRDTGWRLRQMLRYEYPVARKIAPMAVYLVSDAAKDVTAQIFGVRANEIMLFSQPRPIRSVHNTPEWTPEAIAEIAVPSMQKYFYPLERSPDVVSWDPF